MFASESIHILYIEDNVGQARLIEKNLTRIGYQVTLAANGAEGIGQYRAGIEPDAVLVDHSLPDMLGIDVMRVLLDYDALLPVIIVTGRGDEETAVQAMKAGATDYIVKDINNKYIELLPTTIDQAVTQHRLVLEKQQMTQTLFRREAILSAVAQAAERLLKTNTWKTDIVEILGALGAASQVCRVYLLENETEGTPIRVKRCFEWVAADTESRVQACVGKEYAAIGLQRWVSDFQAGQFVHGQLHDLPSSLQQQFIEKDVQSFILMPIFVSNHWWGVIGFDASHSRVWEAAEIEALRTAANILGAAWQRQLTEKALYQAQKLESIGLLAGGVAHDFNNMLTGIMSQISLALMLVPENARVRQPIQKALEVAEQAAELIKQLIGYAGQGHYRLEPVNVNHLIQENRDLLDTVLKKNADLQLDLGVDLPAIEADHSQIQQVLMNLVINAAEAVEQQNEGLVQIRTYLHLAEQPLENIGQPPLPAGEYVCLEVLDNGAGIAPEIDHRVFDPFFSTKAEGRGLGLSAVLGIVHTHHGGLQLSRRNGADGGTIFSIFFPASGQAAVSTPETPAPGGTVQGEILVIDDQEMVLEGVKDGLETLGATVHTATSGPKGIRFYQEHHSQIDLIILDMQMPEMDGRETFAHLKKINPAVKVILSSGYSEAETIQKFTADESIVSFLQKPYRLESLAAEVQRAMDITINPE